MKHKNQDGIPKLGAFCNSSQAMQIFAEDALYIPREAFCASKSYNLKLRITYYVQGKHFFSLVT